VTATARAARRGAAVIAGISGSFCPWPVTPSLGFAPPGAETLSVGVSQAHICVLDLTAAHHAASLAPTLGLLLPEPVGLLSEDGER
jgi:hypothetical protein